jgi:hypothetical protein
MQMICSLLGKRAETDVHGLFCNFHSLKRKLCNIKGAPRIKASGKRVIFKEKILFFLAIGTTLISQKQKKFSEAKGKLLFQGSKMAANLQPLPAIFAHLLSKFKLLCRF